MSQYSWWKYTKKPWEGPWGRTGLYNWADEITSKWNMPEKVELHDCTFRDGEQCTLGAPYNKQDYIDIACAMSDWGINRYEFMPATSKANAEAAKELDKMGLKAEMWGFCRAIVSDIQTAIDVGMEGVCIELSAQGYYTGWDYHGFPARWGPDEMVKMMLDCSKLAKDAGLRVVTFHPQSVVESFDELSAFVKRCTEYADGYCCVDTAGVLTPEGTAFFIEQVRKIRPDLRLEVHAHSRGGAMGTANSITAVAHGCECVQGEMLGFTLPSLFEVAIDLYQMYGMDLGVKWEKTREVCELIAERARFPISPGREFIGRRLGHGQVGMNDSPLLRTLKGMEERLQKGEKFEPQKPGVGRGMSGLLGIVRRKTIGKQSGRGTINLKLWCMGIPEVSYPDECTKILEKVKEFVVRNKQYEISDKDFLRMYEDVVGHPAPPENQRKIPEIIKLGYGPQWLG